MFGEVSLSTNYTKYLHKSASFVTQQCFSMQLKLVFQNRTPKKTPIYIFYSRLVDSHLIFSAYHFKVKKLRNNFNTACSLRKIYNTPIAVKNSCSIRHLFLCWMISAFQYLKNKTKFPLDSTWVVQNKAGQECTTLTNRCRILKSHSLSRIK